MYLLVVEKVKGSPLPGRYLGVAIKRLSKWFSFEKVYERRGRNRVHRTYVVADEDSLNALRALFEVYGYEVRLVERLDEELEATKILKAVWAPSIRKVSEEAERKRAMRILVTYGPVLKREVVEKAAREHGLDISVAERARRSLMGTMVLVLRLRNPRPELFYALGYPLLTQAGFPATYLVPLGRGVERFRESKRAKVSVRDVHELVGLLVKECKDSETLEELSKCEKAVAQRYHASWRALLRKVRAHVLYVDLLANVLMRELRRLGVEVLGYDLWRVRGRGRWTEFTRRQLLDLLAANPELPVKEACRVVGVSYSTARRHLKGDKEYEEIMARRRAQRLQLKAVVFV
jgi:DNA-binding transcriptional ArsR family regulator